MAKSPQKKTPHETVKDACRLCDTTFTDKKDKHNLIIGALEVKPAYTLALEELTGLVVTTGDLIAVCSSCRTLLNRYHRSSCEVERIGTLVKSMSVAYAAARVKRCARSTPTDDERVRKRINIEHESLAQWSPGFPKFPEKKPEEQLPEEQLPEEEELPVEVPKESVEEVVWNGFPFHPSYFHNDYCLPLSIRWLKRRKEDPVTEEDENLRAQGLLFLPLRSIKVQRRWEWLGVELRGPLPSTKNGSRFVMSVLDYYSRWVEVCPLKSINSAEIAQNIHALVSRMGFPYGFLSLIGPGFLREINEKLCEIMGLKKNSFINFHPQTISLDPVSKCLIDRAVFGLAKAHPETWDQRLPASIFRLCCERHPVTGQRPITLLKDNAGPAPVRIPRILQVDGGKLSSFTFVLVEQEAGRQMVEGWCPQCETWSVVTQANEVQRYEQLLLQEEEYTLTCETCRLKQEKERLAAAIAAGGQVIIARRTDGETATAKRGAGDKRSSGEGEGGGGRGCSGEVMESVKLKDTAAAVIGAADKTMGELAGAEGCDAAGTEVKVDVSEAADAAGGAMCTSGMEGLGRGEELFGGAMLRTIGEMNMMGSDIIVFEVLQGSEECEDTTAGKQTTERPTAATEKASENTGAELVSSGGVERGMRGGLEKGIEKDHVYVKWGKERIELSKRSWKNQDHVYGKRLPNS